MNMYPRYRTAFRSLVTLMITLTGASACKLEPVDRIGPSDPSPLPWTQSQIKIPDKRPQSEVSRKLAKVLQQDFEQIQTLADDPALPDSQAPLVNFLTKRFGGAMLAPDGDNRGWTQAVPLRRLQNESWTLSLSIPDQVRQRLRKRVPIPEQAQVDQDSKNWAFRQLHDSGGAQETFSLLRATPELLDEPERLKRFARGRYVLLDATQSKHAQLRAQLLDPRSPWIRNLGAAGAVGCSVFTSLSPEDGLWRELLESYKQPFIELLAPGEAPPMRIESIAVANANASVAWQAWHGGQVQALGPETAGQGPIAKTLVSPPSLVERKGQAVITMNGSARWETEHSVLGRLPGVIRPEKAILVLADWQPTSKGSQLQEQSSDAALTALLGLMQRTRDWHRKGRRTDISILYGALFGGQEAKQAGLAQLLRQKTVRPENIRAVIWLKDFSIRNDTIDATVHSNLLPNGWAQLLELYGGHHMQITPPEPLASDSLLKTLEALEVPVLTFTQADWLHAPETAASQAPPTFVPMAELIDKLLQFTWTITEQSDQDPASESAPPSP